MITIRPATVDDIPAIHRIICACFDGYTNTHGFTPDIVAAIKLKRASEDCICKHITQETTFIAENAAGIVAMASIYTDEITKFYVDPPCHRRGIGRLLYAHAETVIRAAGYNQLQIHSIFPPSWPFYEHLGLRHARSRTVTHGPCTNMTVRIYEKSLT